MTYVLLAGLVAAAVFAFRYSGYISRKNKLETRLRAPEQKQEASGEAAQLLVQWSYAESLLGRPIAEDILPAFMQKPGIECRRANIGLGYFDSLLLMAVVGIGTGLVAFWRFKNWQIGCLVGAGGMWVTYMVYCVSARIRISRLEVQLSDTLDSMVGALQAGIGIRQALVFARQNAREPIATVLGNILVRVDLGVPIPQAFREEAAELRSKYFDLLATAIAANYHAGASLSSMLQGLVRRIRDSIRLQRRVKSLTAEARFSAIVLYAVPILLYLFLNWRNPVNMAMMWKDPIGLLMIKIAIALYFVSMYWMYRMVRVEE